MRFMHTRRLPTAMIAGLISLAPVFVRAEGLRLESSTLPVPIIQDGKVNVVIEASGVEPIGDGRRLLVAHDKDPALYIVDVESGQILGEPLTSPHFPKKNEAGPKWEGMARDSDG